MQKNKEFLETKDGFLQERLYMTFFNKTEQFKKTQNLTKNSFFMPRIAKKEVINNKNELFKNLSIQKGKIAINDKKSQSQMKTRKEPASMPKINANLKNQSISILNQDEPQKKEESYRQKNYDLFQKEKTELKISKLRKLKNENLTCFDFINMIKTDPEMIDEFCYLNKRNHAYDFVLVDFKERRKKEYMTISSRGITHYLNGIGDFIKIEDWEKEAKLFERIGQIQFFKEYKIWKNFFFWKKLTRQNMMQKCKNILIKNLLILDPYLQKSLIEISGLAYQLSNLELMNLQISQPILFNQFIRKQQEYRENQLNYQFVLIESQIKDILQDSCKVSLNAFKISHRISNKDEPQQPLLMGDEVKKDMPFTQKATIKTHYKRLRKYVKIADYLNLQNKLIMINNSMLSISDQLNDFNTSLNDTQKKNNWIICNLNVDQLNLEFIPNQNQISQTFTQLLNNSIESICARNKYFSIKSEIKPFMDKEIDISVFLDLSQVIKDDHNLQQTKTFFNQSLNKSVSVLQKYHDYIQPFMVIYKENILSKELSDSIDIDAFNHIIQKYQQQDSQLNVIDPVCELGMFLLDSSRLKELIKNCAHDCLQSVYQQIPQILESQTSKFLQIVSDVNYKLSWTVNESSNRFVEFFVNYNNNVNLAYNSLQDREDELSNINSLLMLFGIYKIKLPENFKQLVKEANKDMQRMKKNIDEAHAQYDQNLTKCSKKLDRQIPEMQEKIKKLDEKTKNQCLDDKNQNIKQICQYLDELNLDIAEIIDLKTKTNKYQQALGFDVTNLDKILQIEEQFIILDRLWKGRLEFHEFLQKQQPIHFLKLDFQEMENFCIKIKKCSALCEKDLETNEVSKVFKNEVLQFTSYMDTLRPLLDPAVGEKQWNLIRHQSKGHLQCDPEPFKIISDEKYTFNFFCESGITKLKEKYIEIAQQASKEIELIKMVDQLDLFWKESKISIDNYQGQQDVFILKNNEDMISKLDDTILSLNNILGNRFVEGIKYRVEQFLKQCLQLQELIDEWQNHQNTYMYLEPILNTQSSQGGLQKESSQFKKCEKVWRMIMKRVRDFPLCKNWVDEQINRKYFNDLKQNNKSFDQIQKALDDFLDKKRESFQRFSFLSNIELLEILSITKTPKEMIPHLKKLFENLVDLQLDDEETTAQAMISMEGETVALKGCSMRGGEVEDWMVTVEECMKISLKNATRQAIINYEIDDRKDWIVKHCCQVTLTVDSIYWTRMAEEQYLIPDNPSEDDEYGKMDEFVMRIVLDLEDAIDLIRSDINVIQRTNLIALVTQDVHYRDIVQQFYEEDIKHQSNFLWIQQLKFYWEDDMFYAKMVTSLLTYGCEFLGSFSRLVITSLTDRCWMTITNAFHQKLGANPAGPAGTGKTESCKDLAKVLGRFCLVFNCSDQINVKMMEKLFIGIASTGSWTCLDEFNRIDIEVLSVVASQFLQIREALLQQLSSFNFFGKNIELNQYMGLFITFNPGYAGRSELPENLKLLFRPVSMMVPDYALIAENILYSDAFVGARDLARKIQILYKLCSEQLSQQTHYDFGMRSVKSVLTMAGQLKRYDKSLSDTNVILKSLIDSNVPKFITQDKEIFMAIISDLFPGQQIQEIQNKQLVDMCKQILNEKHYTGNDQFMTKILQLYETQKVRFGFMLVGEAMRGKTTLLTTLRQAMTKLREEDLDNEDFYKIECQTFNPKAITIDELYGCFDKVAQTWADGIASKLLRQYTVNIQPKYKYWVCFDGPVDSFWVENMNSVLDDSMILCLSNGERIKLHNGMRIIFEVQNLAQASPATISRCGMIYASNQIVQIEDLILCYFQQTQINQEQRQFFISNLITIVPKVLQFLKTEQEPILTGDQEITMKMLKIFQMIFNDYILLKILENANENVIKKAMNKILIFCVYWGLGSHLSDESQDKFLQFAATFFNPAEIPKIPLFQMHLDFKNRQEGEFRAFQDSIPTFQYQKDKSYNEQVVPTKDTVCYQYFVNKFLDIDSHIFLTGVSGIGKSIIVANVLNTAQNICDIKLTFSSQTTCSSIQENIEYKTTSQRKKGRIIMTPPPGKKLILFVDDVNMPNQEQWGAHPPIELLRQLVDLNGVYDKQGLYFKELESLTLLAAAAHPGGGRSSITQRFTRHLSLFNMPKTNDTVIQSIFGQIVKGCLKSLGFKNEIIDMTGSLVNSTLLLYNQISKEMHPTYEKSHYSFSLRDVSKIFQGILLVRPGSIPNRKTMSFLWCHESQRVFMDKLINNQDKQIVSKTIQQLLQQYLNEKTERIEDIFFADFFKGGEVESRSYDYCGDLEKITKIVSDVMKEESKNQLVLFKDAIKHLVRVCRITRLQNGHMIIVGVGGSGKRSIVQLGGIMTQSKYITLEVSKKYTKKDFRTDLFNIMFMAATSNQHILFLITDKHILFDSQIEDINSLINQGEITGLIGRDEYDRINIAFMEECKIKKINDPLALFYQKIKQQLHIYLSFSPVGHTLKNRFRKFPGLTSCCTINWVLPWPQDALLSVATMFLEDFKYSNITQQTKDKLSELFVQVQLSMEQMTIKYWQLLKRQVYTTPKSYLDLVFFYKELIMKIRNRFMVSKNRLSNGLDKLFEANSTITSLKTKLIDLQPILVKKNVQIKELISKLSQDQLQANQAKKLVEAEANEINIQSEKIMVLKQEADIELKQAQPILQAAVEKLDSLNRGDIGEIKANNNPHQIVKFTMECVAILLDEKTDWDHIKKQILGDAALLSRLKGLKGENITQKTKEKLTKKLASNNEFTPQHIGGINKASKSICEWVLAVDNFTNVYAVIQKKKENCKAMDQELQKANDKLSLKQKELESVIKKVQQLEKNYQDSKQEKESLDNEIKQTEERLKRASQLTEGLADEQVRWKDQVKQLTDELDVLIGNAFLAAASIAYYGPFTGIYRDELVNIWKSQCKSFEIPHSDNYALHKILGNQIEIREWQSKGLSSDTISINNAILIQNQINYPLIIDPQTQAVKWIKNMEVENSLIVLKENSENLQVKIEECISSGRSLLIEDLGETLPSVLDPLLQKQFEFIKNKKTIKFGEENLPFHDTFRLFLATKLQNPHYLPDIYIKVMVLNFTVTAEGLQEKLLGDILAIELPEDDKVRRELIVSVAEDRFLLKKTEDRILDQLTNSRGMILDDVELIESLKISKEIAKAVGDKIEASEIKQLELEKGMKLYTGVALRGVILYFVISELSLIDPMYQFSLNYYSKLFNQIIQTTEGTHDRINLLKDQITNYIFQTICRGLFNRHKRIFSFMLATQLAMQEENTLDQDEFNFLIKGVFVTGCDTPYPPKANFSRVGWNKLVEIRKKCNFYDQIILSMQQNTEQWNDFFENPDIITTQTPFDEISQFQKLLLINIYCYEKTVFAVDEFIRKSLGDDFANPPINKMEEVFKDTDYKTPLIFILSQGADPLLQLMRFAKEMEISQENLYLISLGQGQGPIAEQAIQLGIKSGGWVILQNCHLGKSFMPILEKKLEVLESLTITEINSDFRLILTSSPCEYFPVTVLQNGMKLTCEPPQGIRNNMIQTFNNLNESKFNIAKNKQENFYKITFCISLFHAVILERRKFGPIGFNVFYQFNESDLDTSLNSCKILMEQFSYIPWDALQHLVGQINYGGRITDEWDRRCLQSILSKFCCEQAIKDKYKFVSDGSIYQPEYQNLQNYRDIIKQMPEDDKPEIFGLNPNANLSYQIKETQSIIQTILDIQPRDAGTSSTNQEETIKAIILSLEKKIPENIPNIKNLNLIDCLEVFLQQEIQKFNKLNNMIKSSLNDIKLGINGEILMSAQLDEMLIALNMNRVPKMWEKVGYPSLKPLAIWFDDYVLRVKFIAQWVTLGIPKAFWLSAFYFPQGFITSILQNYARKMKLPIDKISFQFNVLSIFQQEQVLNQPLDGCYVYGLFSEGFRYEVQQNKVTMENSLPGQMYSAMPIIHFIPFQLLTKPENQYEIPIYKTILRTGSMSTTGQSTNYIISVKLPYTHSPDYWIMQGSAIFCSLTD